MRTTLLVLVLAVDTADALFIRIGGLPTAPLRRVHSQQQQQRMSLPLSKASFVFDFDNVPYMDGVRHIHSPEHVTTTHRLGAPFFRINDVQWPIIARSTRPADNKNSIRFSCSTLVTKDMRIRMYTHQINESNLLFFDGSDPRRRALYKARFYITPTKAFTGHRMHLDITLFSGTAAWKTLILTLMPVFVFVNGLEDTLAFHGAHTKQEEGGFPQFEEYRRAVLLPVVRPPPGAAGNSTGPNNTPPENASSEELWALAREVIRKYVG